MRWSRFAAAAVVLAASSSALAMYRAADLVVVPVAAAIPGLNNSNWRSDVEIQNVSADPIDVLIIFLPSGVGSNAVWYSNISKHLGGRSEDGFGKIDPKLKDIPAGRTVYIEDPIKTHWNENAKGALLVFGFKAGTYKTTTPPGGEPRPVVVRSRTFSLGKTSDDKPTTYGQSIPGLPWYYYIDIGQEAKGLNEVRFSGIREDASYRTALGLLNFSDASTTLYVQCTLTAEDGTQMSPPVVTRLNPLEHVQYDKVVQSLFSLTTDSVVTGATITVKVVLMDSPVEHPTPALIVYGSRIDNTTNDPVYLEQAFVKELPWDCVFNGNCAAATALSGPQGALRRRPLAPPFR